MTHTSTEQERKLFEAVASDDGKWPQAIERDAKGNYLLLTTANDWMWWQAARQAQVAPSSKNATVNVWQQALHEEEDEEDDDSEYDCPHCGGTGEGQYDGQTCSVCRGKGVCPK